MIEFNDSNADYSQGGISVFTSPVNADEDIFISSSCVFLSEITTSGKIRAQYSLIVHGAICADNDIDIGGELQCTSMKGQNIVVGGRMSAKEEVACNNLFVAGDAFVGSIFSANIEIQGSLVSLGMVDAAGSITVHNAIISLDIVQASGKVVAQEAIAADFSFVEEDIFRKIQTSNMTITENNPPAHLVSISDSNCSDIFNAHSSLAIGIDDCATFLDRLNEDLCCLNYGDEKLRNYLVAFGDFFPDYQTILEIIDSIIPVLQKQEIENLSWFDDFNTCVSSLIKLPSWFINSNTAKSLHDKILALLSFQATNTILTKSFSSWSLTNYHLIALKGFYNNDPQIHTLLSQLQERLLSNISLKRASFDIIFTQE